MPAIHLHNRQRKLALPGPELESFCARALALCLREPSPGQSTLAALEAVNIVLVSDRRMAALHRQFMNLAGPTDVITFQHGDIFVSTETAARQAQEFGTSAEKEVRLYVVHGLLHLHGFDDRIPAERRALESVQRRLLAAASRA